MTPSHRSPGRRGPDDGSSEAPGVADVLDAAAAGAISPDTDAAAAARVGRRGRTGGAVDERGDEVAGALDDGRADASRAPRRGSGVARNTAIFSVATALSRLAGLAREIVAARYFGTSGAASAFTIAFQVPNLVRGLFADAALSAAFVPVFTEYLERGKRREAMLLASTLFWLILLVLGTLTAFFIVAAGVVMPLFVPGDQFTPQLVDLTVGLSQVLFPVVVLLGLNGLLVGILNAHHHFTVPALAPLVWNIIIIGTLIGLHGVFEPDKQIYAYAIGVLVGTIVQLLMVVPVLGRIDLRLQLHVDWRDPGVRRVLHLMLPVTIGLGVINVDLLINSVIGALIADSVPRAIDAAFRIYMLPQGMFSVALATVLFPSLSRLVARRDIAGLRSLLGTGARQNLLLLVPAAVLTAVLAAPIVELIYQYGSFGRSSTEEVAKALFWFSFSLPFAGINLLLTRAFFSLQRPWVPTSLAAASLAVNVAVSLALYRPLGIAGPVIGTAIASAVMTAAQAGALRRDLHGSIEGARTLDAAARILVASVPLALVAYGVWWLISGVVGDGGPLARLIAVGPAVAAGLAAYALAVLLLRIPEAEQIRRFVSARIRRRRPAA